MNYFFLANSSLFHGMAENEIKDILECFGAGTAEFERGDIIYRCGQTVDNIGMVLSGGVIIESDDLWGNRSVIGHIEPGHIFAESYACISAEPLLVSVVAAEKTQILFINAAKLLNVCPNSCAYHNAMIKNLLKISSQKTLHLSRRILYTSSKTIRGRLMTFFSDKVKQTGSYTVTVPFNRQQLADYLGLDRSAMCNELSKMQSDGLLTYEKNTFRLKGSGFDLD